MESNSLKILLRALFFLLAQVLVVDHVQLFSGIVAAFVYPAVLLYLPIRTSTLVTMLVGVAVGLVMDAFSNTLGLHTSAIVLLAYIRRYVLQIMAPREGYEMDVIPGVAPMGRSWFIIYTAILLFCHHFWLFNLENFQFSGFWNTQLRMFLSWIVSLTLVLLFEFLTYRVVVKR